MAEWCRYPAILLLLTSCSFSELLAAQDPVKVFQYTDKKGTVSFSDRQPLDVPYTLVKSSCTGR